METISRRTTQPGWGRTTLEPRVILTTALASAGGAELCLADLVASGVTGARLDVILGGPGRLADLVRERGLSPEWVAPPDRLTQLGDAVVASRRGGRWIALKRAASTLGAAWNHRRALRHAWRQRHPSAIVTLDLKTHLLAVGAIPPTSSLIWWMHDDPSIRPVATPLLRQAVRLAARHPGGFGVVTCSGFVAEQVKRALNPPEHVPIVPILNSIDLERLLGKGTVAARDHTQPECPEQPPPKAVQGTGGTRLRIGLVATYARWKGHEVVLRALAALPERLVGRVEGVVVGGPIYRNPRSQWSRDELERLADHLGLGQPGRPPIQFRGHVDVPARVFDDLDMVVHASTRPEPFGRVIAEALALGLPVVTPGLGGAAEAAGLDRQPTPDEVASGSGYRIHETCLTVPPNDPHSLAEALTRLVEDEPLRRRLARSGPAFARNAFDLGRLPDQWAEAIARVSATARRRGSQPDPAPASTF